MNVSLDTYGWYNFKWNNPRSELVNITNRQSKQQLVIQKTIDYAIRFDSGKKIVALYQDNNISQKVNFSILQNVDYKGKPENHFNIIFNYAEIFQNVPNYGLWRRIDDFITDALLCWQPMHIYKLVVIGGWLSNAWSKDHQRIFDAHVDLNNTRTQETCQPQLYNLDWHESFSWHLIDIDKPKDKAELEYEVYPNTIVPFLPKHSALKGFQDKVPYLKREDGNSYFIFSRVNYSIHPYSDCTYTDSYYFYIDEDVFFQFKSDRSWNSDLCQYVTDYGFRSFPFESRFWARDFYQDIYPINPTKKTSHYLHLTYPVWLKIRHAYCDAWKEWQKCKNKLTVESRFEYRGQMSNFKWDDTFGGRPVISGGFVAGLPTPMSIEHKYRNTE